MKNCNFIDNDRLEELIRAEHTLDILHDLKLYQEAGLYVPDDVFNVIIGAGKVTNSAGTDLRDEFKEIFGKNYL